MSKLVPCDYCGSSNEAKTIFSAQKSFVGIKMLDVLQIITHRELPGNLALKVCFMCASNLMTTMGVIEKTGKMVDKAITVKSVTAVKNKKADIQTVEPDKQVASAIVDLTMENEAKNDKPKTTPVAKNKTLRQRSKSMAVRPSDLEFPESPAKKLKELNASPLKKTPKKEQSRFEDNLDDSVRLTPAKEVAPNKKVFLQLFGSRNADADAAPESEEEDEDENAADENADKVITMKKGFDCKLCDFQTATAKLFKEHLNKEHGQQRPRIYFCDMCSKSFGVLKSWRVHIETVHGVTVEAPKKETKSKVVKLQTKDSKEDEVKPIEKSPRKQKSQKAIEKIEEIEAAEKKEAKEEIQETIEGPQLATIKALNGEAAAKKKWLDKVISNPDYTFDVNGSSASTPKAADLSIELSNEFKCDICDSELASAKQMQEHMRTAHGIDKPKIFKCPVCDKALTTKQSLKHHMNLHTEGAEAEKSSKRKILQDEKEADGIAEKIISDEDDEKPKEEKILHMEMKENNGTNDTADESGIMAPPKSPGKKPKKVKNSSSPDTPNKSVDVSDSPGKKTKRKIDNNETSLNETTEVVNLLDEINRDVKPHKKARLQSVSDSFCSSIDDYSTAEETPLTCSHCGKQVKSKQRLALHIQKRHGTKLVCPGCKTTYENQRDYVNHFAVCSSGGSLLPCGVALCKKTFYEAKYLASHLFNKHQWK